MKKQLLTIGALMTASAFAFGDTVVTQDGARLTGTIQGIDGGVIKLETAYAGVIEIKQELVKSFETENPVFVRLESGATMSGPVKSSGGNTLKIMSTDGVLETQASKVSASWSPAGEDPALARAREAAEKLKRKWKYRATLDFVGRDGNSEELALGAGFEAKLKSPNDELRFFGKYEQNETNGDKTTDRASGGLSYESFFSDVFGWYARTELETNAIDNIEMRSTNGVGLSYRLLNKEHQTLVARSGLGYRYTAFDDNVTENESTATLDFGLLHTYTYKNVFTMENSLTYVPSIDDFGVYTAVHDTGIELPIGAGNNWKIRIGLLNEYESEPAAEESLDTTYYTKMVYSWD